MDELKVEFTKELEIGVPVIDAQHREYINRLAVFLEKCHEGIQPDDLKKHFEFVETYVLEHFDYEELFMLEQKLPCYEEQVDQHLYFKNYLEHLREEIENEGFTYEVLEDVYKLFYDWFLKHIKKSDIRIGELIQEQD